MKTIDIKSLLIGILLASTIFLGIAATSPTDKWDRKQEWRVTAIKQDLFNLGSLGGADGWEPFAAQGNLVIARKRTK